MEIRPQDIERARDGDREAFGRLYEAVARGVSSNDALQLIDVIPFRELWVPVAASFAGAGVFIGVGGSLSAIRKYLQV